MKNPLLFRSHLTITSIRGGLWDHSNKSVLVFGRKNAYRRQYRGHVVGFRVFRAKE